MSLYLQICNIQHEKDYEQKEQLAHNSLFSHFNWDLVAKRLIQSATEIYHTFIIVSLSCVILLYVGVLPSKCTSNLKTIKS